MTVLRYCNLAAWDDGTEIELRFDNGR